MKEYLKNETFEIHLFSVSNKKRGEMEVPMFTRNHLRNQKVLIAGCGRFSACLASALGESGYDVIVIDKCEAAFKRLCDSFGGFEIVGDAADLNVLESCDIRHCDMVLVATDDDNANCMIAQIANTIYHIDQVYIRLNDPNKEKLLEQSSIKAIYPARLSVQEFEHISHISLKEEQLL